MIVGARVIFTTRTKAGRASPASVVGRGNNAGEAYLDARTTWLLTRPGRPTLMSLVVLTDDGRARTVLPYHGLPRSDAGVRRLLEFQFARAFRWKHGDRVQITTEARARYLAGGVDADYVAQLARPAVVERIQSDERHGWTTALVRYDDGAHEWFPVEKLKTA